MNQEKSTETEHTKTIKSNEQKNHLTVNIYGGPGSGKSTTALQLAAELKKRGFYSDYVSEVAKEYVYAKKFERLDGSLKNQSKLFLEQKSRLDLIYENVDITITDCPLLLNAVYLKEHNDDFVKDIFKTYNKYNNLNLFLERDLTVKFEQEGRIHDLTQSIEKDNEITSLLKENNIDYQSVDRNDISSIADFVVKAASGINAEYVKGEKSPMNKEQIDRLTKNLSAFYADEFDPHHLDDFFRPSDYLKKILVDEPYNERLFCNILKELTDNLTLENANTKGGQQIAMMISDLTALMANRTGAASYNLSDVKDSIIERNAIENFTSSVISNIDNLKSGDVQRAYNYSAECTEHNKNKDVMFSQYLNEQKENLVNVSYNDTNKEMTIDVKSIPKRLSEIAMTSFEKVNKLVSSITIAAEKSLQIAKNRIFVKFPKGFQFEADKIPLEAITQMMDRYYINPQEIDINDLTNLFARSQKHTSDIDRKSSFQYEFGNAKEIIRDAVQSLSHDDNSVPSIQVYMTKTGSYPNQLNGNDCRGSLCIELHNDKRGLFKAYVPLLESESMSLMEKIGEVDRNIIYQKNTEIVKQNLEMMKNPEFQNAVMEIADLVNASITPFPSRDNLKSYIVNKGERGFISNITTPNELIRNLTYNETPTPELKEIMNRINNILGETVQDIGHDYSEAKENAIRNTKANECALVIADIAKITDSVVYVSGSGNYNIIKDNSYISGIETPQEMVNALLRGEESSELNDLCSELQILSEGDFKNLNDIVSTEEIYEEIKKELNKNLDFDITEE